MWVTSLVDDLDLHSAPDGTKRGYRARGRERPNCRHVAVQGMRLRSRPDSALVAEPSLRRYPGRLGPAASLPPRDPPSCSPNAARLRQGDSSGEDGQAYDSEAANPPPAVVSRAQAFERIRAHRATRRGRVG
jgi:hypothetical protein